MRESNSLEEYFFRLYKAIANKPHTFRTIKGKVHELTNCKELRIENEHIIYEPGVI